MKYDFTKIIPPRYHKVSYENDIRDEIKEIIKGQIQKRDGLYIQGAAGTGKTYLVCALAKYMLENGYEVRFFNTGDMLEKIREEFKNEIPREEDEKGLFREIMDFQGILFLDDIGAEKVSDWVRERIYLIINKRYENLLPTIFTSNIDLEILSSRLDDRVASRIREMTEIIILTGQDKRLIK